MWSQCNLDTAAAWAASESLVKFLWDEDYSYFESDAGKDGVNCASTFPR